MKEIKLIFSALSFFGTLVFGALAEYFVTNVSIFLVLSFWRSDPPGYLNLASLMLMLIDWNYLDTLNLFIFLITINFSYVFVWGKDNKGDWYFFLYYYLSFANITWCRGQLMFSQEGQISETCRWLSNCVIVRNIYFACIVVWNVKSG